jgi:hypothetical protein
LLKGYITQWGKDPIWSAAAPPSQAMPLPEHFINAITMGTELTLDELSNGPFIPFTAVGHKVDYDDQHGRRLWYCDIEMNMGEAYFPFVRLALARYQPQSLADAHLSRVVLADFIQLLPDRSASITFDPIDTTAVPPCRQRAHLYRFRQRHHECNTADASAGRGRSGVGAGVGHAARCQHIRWPRHAVDREHHAAGAARLAAVPAPDPGI